MLDTTPPEQRTRSWAMKWLFRGPIAFKAAGIEWSELMNAPDDPQPQRSFGRPPQWQPGDDRTEYTRSRSYTRSHDHLTH